MATQTTLELNLNVTASATWTQVKNQAAGSAYTVGASKRADIRNITISNLGANSSVIDLAISTDSTVTDDEKLLAPLTLAAGYTTTIDQLCTLPATFGLWLRATGTSPNVTLSAVALEVTP